MSGSDSTNQAHPSETPDAASNPAETVLAAGGEAAASDAAAEAARRRILIGSQRDPAAYRPRRRDWVPVEDEGGEKSGDAAAAGGPSAGKKHRGRRPPRDRRGDRLPEQPSSTASGAIASGATGVLPALNEPCATAIPAVPSGLCATAVPAVQSEPSAKAVPAVPAGDDSSRLTQPRHTSAADASATQVPREEKLVAPSVRDRLTPDMEAELDRAMGDAQLDDLLGAGGPADEGMLEPESQHRGRIVAIRRDDVFLELGGREQGIISLQHFTEPPQIGAMVDVVVQRFKADEGLYELAPPNTAMRVEDWGDLSDGMMVEARVTGHNAGGLECEVNHIRGFIPISQVALYRVEDLAPFVGQGLTCLVTEANPERRNLVLSRRAVLEREKQEAREQLIRSIQPGQIREGVVRKLLDFGAFVDLGGVDGLLHVSQLAWHRVNHPSEVLSEGQTIRVKIERVDPDTGKLSLGYRDLFESPWAQAAAKYPPQMQVKGKVTKLMEFGAFVALEPGVEGLVHISELSHKRVWRASDVVKEGDEVDVLVLAVDAEAQRISLSMKALAAPPEPTKKEKEQAESAGVPVPSKRRGPERPLQGGLGRVKGGERFGLKW